LTRIDYVFLKFISLSNQLVIPVIDSFFIEMYDSVEYATKPFTRQHNAYKSVIGEYYNAYCGSGIGVVEMVYERGWIIIDLAPILAVYK
jgi:hypothetical protein